MVYTFSYYSHTHDLMFRGVMESHQCQFIKRNQERCKRRCILPFEFCHSHLEPALGLAVKTSNLPNSGKGLFTTVDRRRGDKLCLYNGEVINRDQLNERYGDLTAPYCVMVSGNNLGTYIDSATERGVASFANTYPAHNNARLVVNQRNKKVSLEATRNIAAGSEIYTSYGQAYRMPSAQTYYYKTKPYLTMY
jgi:hypothetical protein